MTTAANPLTTALDGPAVELEVVSDMARRGLPAVAVLVAVMGAFWGLAGLASAGFGAAVALANLALSAAIMARTARISIAVMMASALFGYVLRLALVAAAVLLVKDAGWVRLWPLGLTLVITHLGLLAWETRYVSASLAFPALKPTTKGS